jgi:hypothetical protein
MNQMNEMKSLQLHQMNQMKDLNFHQKNQMNQMNQMKGLNFHQMNQMNQMKGLNFHQMNQMNQMNQMKAFHLVHFFNILIFFSPNEFIFFIWWTIDNGYWSAQENKTHLIYTLTLIRRRSEK